MSGLVLLLPHGYEGQGPEHSSARLERYLQSCAEHNIQVAQPTTPAQMFHLLRSQVLCPLRKPLVVMTPKSLLRLPAATSTLDELATGRYHRVLADEELKIMRVTRVVLCTGQILGARRRAARRADATRRSARLETLPVVAQLVAAATLDASPAAERSVRTSPSSRASQFGVTRGAFAGHRSSTSDQPRREREPATGSHKAHMMEQADPGWRSHGPPRDAAAAAARSRHSRRRGP
jgi:2-oxoglutarate dehydrogenase E1 component